MKKQTKKTKKTKEIEKKERMIHALMRQFDLSPEDYPMLESVLWSTEDYRTSDKTLVPEFDQMLAIVSEIATNNADFFIAGMHMGKNIMGG